MKHKRIHPMKRRKLHRMIKNSIAYVLNYIFPIIILLVGLVITYKLLITFGYNHETQMWDINNAFCYSLAGLGGTIIVTFVVSKILRKIADYIDYHK